MRTPARSLFICLMLGLVSPVVLALALSDIEVSSHLNQHLDARIRLNSATQADLDSLNVNVTEIQVEGQSYVSLQEQMGKDDQGSFIHITSREPIREPILKLLVEVSWANGRLTRDYSLIIDPR
ncbi:MAG: hypothetical protein HYY48_04140 [Gammaproteobacteria bacterium]|nr:hypothetical protein [Gammaproteobacteria bacterium]